MESNAPKPIRIATRGSNLALTQTGHVRDALQALFPERPFELKIIKTSGDKMPTADLAHPESSQPRGLFTKELENALLEGEADLAVHSLKDLPTELPQGLGLAATPQREDVREVLIYRSTRCPGRSMEKDWSPGARDPLYSDKSLLVEQLPPGSVVATSSTRRAAAIRAKRTDLLLIPIRGNVGTRLQKLASSTEFDATLLAAAGLVRLSLDISPKGELRVDPRLPSAIREKISPPPAGLTAMLLEPEEFLPAVGQGALGLEARINDTETWALCQALNHVNTFAAVTAERSFLSAMGGGCQSPVGAWARVVGHQLHLVAETYENGVRRRAEGRRVIREAVQLGQEVADLLKAH